MSGKKKLLPVVASSSSGSGGAGGASGDEPTGVEPSILIWTSVGIVFAFALWLPFAYLAAKLGASSIPELQGATSADELARRIATLPESARAAMQTRVASFQLLALVLAHLAGGAIVAKFGKLTQLRAWTIVGLFTTGITFLLASFSGGFTPFALVPLPLAASASAAGGWLTRRLAR